MHDVTIIGSGFAGSILARVLATRGVRVVMVDPARHPRFAIGESSTPIADTMLRRIGTQYELPDLVSMSTWGSWKRDHADLNGGMKRGFSYFHHDPDRPFAESRVGERSLLVAASPDDEVSDTHWYRPDMDRFLFDRAIDAGVVDGSGLAAKSLVRDGTTWKVDCGSETFTSQWVIDASGRSSVASQLLRSPDRADELRTRTHSRFGHFRGVRSWSSMVDDATEPFDADDAAQHHLLGRAWMWMLRMGGDITSVGVTGPLGCSLDWDSFPSIAAIMERAKLIAPDTTVMQTTERLQRWFDPTPAEGVILLPTASLTLDPLHSTGIAHALAGVQRVANIMVGDANADAYATSLDAEAKLLDLLVSTAYAVMDDFDRFTAACMVFFAAAIRCEESLNDGETPTALWCADEVKMMAVVRAACDVISDRTDSDYDAKVRDLIAPYNAAGLMDASVCNRYAYTATKKSL